MKIVQSNAKLRATMNKLLAKEGNRALKNASKRIKRRVKHIFYDAINDCPEILELSGFDGKLRKDFGLSSDPTPEIIDDIVDSAFVEVKRITSSGGTFKGGLTVGLHPSAYANLLGLPQASQLTEKGVLLPWLEWLLFKGDQIIVQNYGVEYGAGFGRSGGARMSEDEPPFKVDPRYAGTVESNFITRAIIPFMPAINRVVKEELTR